MNSFGMHIAIIGMAIRFPMADTLDEYWNILLNGVDCVRPIPFKRKQLLEPYLNTLKNTIDNRNFSDAAYLDTIEMFDYTSFRMTKREAELMDPNHRLFLTVSKEALDDAFFDYKNRNVGVYVGYLGCDDYFKMLQVIDPQSISAALTGNCAPVLSGRVSQMFDFTGPNMLINTSCSSSLVAVHEACQALMHNQCEIAIAGGVEVHPVPLRNTFIGIESGDGKARPFDDMAQGTGSGEGVGVIVLKPLDKALENNDRIYAVIRGGAINHDGRSMTISSPNPAAQEKLLCTAWENAGINPCDIGCIEAHGTGTKIGDPIEIQGIRKAFRHYTNADGFCAVGAVKSNIGHLDGAAGIAGFIKAVLQLQYKTIVPTVHFKRLNRNIDPNHLPVYISSDSHPFPVYSGRRICGVSSFGISGTNCHMVVEEFQKKGHEGLIENYKTRQRYPITRNKTEECWLSSPSARRVNTDQSHTTSTVDRLCRILEGMFDNGTISPEQDFLLIGGDSLLALEYLNEINRCLQVSITVAEILNHTVILDLAALIDSKRKNSPSCGVALAKDRVKFPLTYMQKGIYIQHCLNCRDTLNNISSAFLIQGPLDTLRLNDAFQEVVNHNLSFRSSIQAENNDVFQVVEPDVSFQINMVESAGKMDLDSLSQYIQPFDLTTPPLLNVHLIEITKHIHILVADMHHIISDGISNACLMQEVAAYYQKKTPPDKKIDYSDYAEWHYRYIKNQNRYIHQTRYYQSLLKHPGIIEFPSDKTKRDQLETYRTIEFELPKKLSNKLSYAASRYSTTEFTILFSLFFLLIYDLTRNQDLTVGTVASGRLEKEHQCVLGMFVNLLAIRVRINNNRPFGDFIRDVYETMKSAIDIQCYPYELLIKDLKYDVKLNGLTLFNTVFVMQNYRQTSLDIDNLHLTRLNIDSHRSKYDLYVNCYKRNDDILSFTWLYSLNVFDTYQVNNLWERFCTFISEVAYAYDTTIGKFLEKTYP